MTTSVTGYRLRLRVAPLFVEPDLRRPVDFSLRGASEDAEDDARFLLVSFLGWLGLGFFEAFDFR